MPNKNSVEFGFEVTYQQIDGKHTLAFSTEKPAGVKDQIIEVTAEQWNALRYHFMTAVDDKRGLTKLAYIA